jgi:dihydrofolate synthase/folylpolyglutamate synthase
METGLGGRYDATNTVTRADKIALFTDIGYDHVEILGHSLARIAEQKAGIIQRQNRVLTYLQPPEAQGVIAAECEVQGARLHIFDPAAAISDIRLHPETVVFDLDLAFALSALPPMHALQLSLVGAHQAHNAGLAIAAAELFLRDVGRTFEEESVRQALAHVSLPGRMDQRTWRGVRFIIDGAHNAQKIHALCSALVALYPEQRFVFVVALKQGKDHSAIFAQLLPLAAHLILTRFENDDQGMPLQATEPAELVAGLATLLHDEMFQDIDVPVTVVTGVAEALALAASVAHSDLQPLPVVVTGSLYLLAEVYAVLDEPLVDNIGQR